MKWGMGDVSWQPAGLTCQTSGLMVQARHAVPFSLLAPGVLLSSHTIFMKFVSPFNISVTKFMFKEM